MSPIPDRGEPETIRNGGYALAAAILLAFAPACGLPGGAPKTPAAAPPATRPASLEVLNGAHATTACTTLGLQDHVALHVRQARESRKRPMPGSWRG